MCYIYSINNEMFNIIIHCLYRSLLQKINNRCIFCDGVHNKQLKPIIIKITITIDIIFQM